MLTTIAALLFGVGSAAAADIKMMPTASRPAASPAVQRLSLPNPCNTPAVGVAVPGCGVIKGVGGAVESSVGAAAGVAQSQFLGGIAKDFSDSAGEAIKQTLTWWLNWKTVDPSRSDTVQWVKDHLWAVTSLIGVAGIAAGGVAIAWYEFRGLEILAGGMGRLLLGWWTAIPAIGLLVAGGDAFSKWVLSDVNSKDVGEMTVVFGQSLAAAGGPGLVFVLALVAMVSSLAQFFLAVLRDAMLLLVTGMLGTAAAMSFFKWGKPWFDRSLAWTLALVLYKPVASIIYAAALVQVTTAKNSGDLHDVLAAIALMAGAAIAFPALLRISAPIAAQATGGSGGGSGSLTAASLAMRSSGGPSGAVATRSSGGGAGMPRGGGGGGGGAVMVSGPSGAAKTAGAAKGAAAAGGAAAGAAGGPVGIATAAAAQTAGAAKRRVAEGFSGPTGAVDEKRGGRGK